VKVSDAVLCFQEALVVVEEIVTHLLADVLASLSQFVHRTHELAQILLCEDSPLVFLKVEILAAKLLYKRILSFNFFYHTLASCLLCRLSPFPCVYCVLRAFH